MAGDDITIKWEETHNVALALWSEMPEGQSLFRDELLDGLPPEIKKQLSDLAPDWMVDRRAEFALIWTLEFMKKMHWAAEYRLRWRRL